MDDRTNEARANLQRLPMISGEPEAAPDQGVEQEREMTLDQIFASEKEALKQESKAERRTQRQADDASSHLVEALEQQAEKAQALDQQSTQTVARQAHQMQEAGAQAEGQQVGTQAAGQKAPHGQAAEQPAEIPAATEDAAPDISKTPTVPLGPRSPQMIRKPRPSSTSANPSLSVGSIKADAAEKPRRTVGQTILVMLLVLLCIYLLGFGWNQWLHGDDETDIQGVWQIAGSEKTITITKDYIQLTPDVKYPYTIDTTGKIITFTFEELSGEGRYRFSLDRNQLAIIEGPDFSTIGNTFNDVFWFGRSLFWWVFTQEMVSPGVETTAQRNQKAAEKQAEIDQEKAEEAQEEAQEEIKEAAESDYVLGSQLIKKVQAIKGIKSTAKKEEGTTVDLPTECTILIRTDQPVEISGEEEKPVMIIELRDTSSSGQSDEQSGATQEKQPLIVEVPSTSSSEQSSGSTASGSASAWQPPESSGSDGTNGSS
ncbi:MAG: hypothetical protein J5818_00420 [Eggerthellaceae bacterium]|nr:hypothetical protein [Eggerthellaceae bacterium]